MHLPKSQKLPVNLLAACFNHKVATYKYYWLLSIVELIERGNSVISKKDLFSRMISITPLRRANLYVVTLLSRSMILLMLEKISLFITY